MELELVTIENEQPVTTSLKVAEVFEKKHKHVLESIRRILAEAPRQNSAKDVYFIESEYFNDLTKKHHPMYYITKRGFTLLAMGFTGSKALGFKISYMDAFEKMENSLNEKTSVSIQQKQMSHLEILQASINALVDQEHRLTAVESNVESLTNKMIAFEQEREDNARLLAQARIEDATKVPELTMRDKIRLLINAYSSATNTRQQDIWHAIYSELYYRYKVSVNNMIPKNSKETKLDMLENRGHMPKVYSIICKMCNDKGIN